MTDKTYCYPPDYQMLRNRFGVRAQTELNTLERYYVSQRLQEAIPTGDFDLRHLKAIHRHLFQDIYDWAGKNPYG